MPTTTEVAEKAEALASAMFEQLERLVANLDPRDVRTAARSMYDANEAERLSGGTEPRVWIRMAAAMLLNLLAAPPTTALDLEPQTTSASVELAERAEALAATMLDQLDGFAVDLDQFDTSRSWQHLHEANKAETYTVATRPNRARRRSAMMLIVGVSVRRGNAVLDDEDDDGDELIGS